MEIEIVAVKYIYIYIYIYKGIVMRIQIETEVRLPGMLKARTSMKKASFSVGQRSIRGFGKGTRKVKLAQEFIEILR